MMAAITTIDPRVIKNHRNTRLGVIFIRFFFFAFFFNIMLPGLWNKHVVYFPDGNRRDKVRHYYILLNPGRGYSLNDNML